MENLKIYHKDVKNTQGTIIGFDEIACYTVDGSYVIRISKFVKLYYYGGEKRNTFTKNFKDKNHANNYFKKISEGYTRVK